MSGTTILILVLVGLGAVVAAVITYYVLRWMRGSLKIHLPQTGFRPGDVIAGRIDLRVKKPIEGNRLYVGLVGTEVTRTRGSDGRTRSSSREIHRDERTIEEARSYPAGHSASHDFELAAPKMSESDLAGSLLGGALKTAATLLSGRRTRNRPGQRADTARTERGQLYTGQGRTGQGPDA